MPRLIHSLALSAAVVMSVVAFEPRASAEGQDTHGVYHTQFERLGQARAGALSGQQQGAAARAPAHGHGLRLPQRVVAGALHPPGLAHARGDAAADDARRIPSVARRG